MMKFFLKIRKNSPTTADNTVRIGTESTCRTMIKKILIILMAFLLMAGSQKKIRVGFILATVQEERYQKDKAYFIEAAKNIGAEVLFDDANNNSRMQLEKVENMLTKGVDILVLQPTNSDTACPMVEMARKKGVPVIAYDRIINNCDLEYYVSQDSFKVGVVQAKAAVKATKGKGNYIILMGESGHSVANEITRGNHSVLDKNPDIKVVVEQNHQAWSPVEAMRTVENALSRFNNDIQAILANNSGMIRGAIEALKEHGLERKVFTAGSDADLINCQYVVKGIQSMDVLKGIKPLAATTARVAVEIVYGKKPMPNTTIFNGKTNVKVVLTPIQPFDRKNIDEVIIKSGFHKKEEVYK